MNEHQNTYTREELPVRPIFDMELLLGLLQETRLGGQVVEDLANTWERWLPLLHVLKLDTGKIRYLLIWLDESVEKEVDEAWAKSATEGFRLNALAQTMCMCTVYQAEPEVQDAGCAPAPRPTEALRQALAAEGVPYQEDGPTLSRRYAVLTHFPFRGACDICVLQPDCPKANGSTDAAFHTVELGLPPLSSGGENPEDGHVH